MIFSQIYLKIGRRTTQTRKGTTISIFSKYFIYFILLYQFGNFTKLYMRKQAFGENLIKSGLILHAYSRWRDSPKIERYQP